MKKRLPHIITLTFLIIFALQLVGLLFLLTIPENASAQTVDLQVPIGGTTNVNTEKTTAGIAKYIEAVYKYGIGIVGIVATVVMMIGGVSWIMAGGNAAKIGEAKTWIGSALVGLVLALTSYTILNTINPDLTSFTPKEIKMIEPVKDGCCLYKVEDKWYAENMTDALCKNKEDSRFEVGKIQSTQGCIDPEDQLVCCIVKNRTFFSGEWYDCYANIRKDECKNGGFMIDWDPVEDVIIEDAHSGACVKQLTPFTSCSNL